MDRRPSMLAVVSRPRVIATCTDVVQAYAVHSRAGPGAAACRHGDRLPTRDRSMEAVS